MRETERGNKRERGNEREATRERERERERAVPGGAFRATKFMLGRRKVGAQGVIRRWTCTVLCMWDSWIIICG